MGRALDALKERLAAIGGLDHAGSLMGWDQETYMPEGGAGSRARATATVGRLGHELGTSAEYGRLLGAAEAEVAAAGSAGAGDEARLLWRARKDYERAVRVPAAFVAELREAEVLATQVWQAARGANDWARFAPHLERIVGQQRRLADYLGHDHHPYDALLDGYEPELRTADVRRVFADLCARTAPTRSTMPPSTATSRRRGSGRWPTS